MHKEQIALHVATHPDDGLIGAPAALFALRDAGFRVVNLACGLGRSEQHARRAAELAMRVNALASNLSYPTSRSRCRAQMTPSTAQDELVGL